MKEINVTLFFVIIFLLVQFLGLYIGSQYLEVVNAGQIEPVFENPQSSSNSFLLIIYVLVGTGLILLAVKFWKFLIRIIEAVAIFSSSTLAFMFLVPVEILTIPVGVFIALALTAWKMLRPTFISQNIALVFSVAGAGAIIGASLGIVPSLIFIILLSIYDFIAVFVTKHMVYMAKEIIKTPTVFTLAFPYKFKKPVKFSAAGKSVKKKFHVFQLGGGDIAIPLMFSVSSLSSFSIANTLLSVVGSTIALGVLIYFSSKRPGRALPALPFITAGAILGLLISFLIF